MLLLVVVVLVMLWYGATDGGGGGAGGFVTNAPGNPYAPYGPSVSFAAPTPYAVTVGDGGTINLAINQVRQDSLVFIIMVEI